MKSTLKYKHKIKKNSLEITKRDSNDVETTILLKHESETVYKEKTLCISLPKIFSSTLSKIIWIAVRFFVSFLICR